MNETDKILKGVIEMLAHAMMDHKDDSNQEHFLCLALCMAPAFDLIKKKYPQKIHGINEMERKLDRHIPGWKEDLKEDCDCYESD